MTFSSESSSGSDVSINMDHVVQESCVLNKPNSSGTKKVLCKESKLALGDKRMRIRFCFTKMLRTWRSMDEIEMKMSREIAMPSVAGFKMKHCFASLVIFLTVFVIFLFV